MEAPVLIDRAKRKRTITPVEHPPVELPLVVGNETARTPQETVYVLTRYLAGRCDGARVQDGTGFNRIDAKLGHKLADMDFVEWTPRQLWAARRMLEHYKNRQLREWWSIVPDVPEPTTAEQRAAKERRNTWLKEHGQPHVEDGEFRRLTLDRVNGQQVVVLQHNFDPVLVEAVKRTPGRRFDNEKKRWFFTLDLETLERSLDFALEWGYEIPPAVHEACEQVWEKMSSLIQLSHAADHEYDIPGLGGEMFPFQRAGVAYAEKARNVLIGDEMGLGKTVQALAAAKKANEWPVVVICPASLKDNWKREAKKWIPGIKVAVLTGRLQPLVNFDGTPVVDMVIINYNSRVLGKWERALIELKPKLVICDESHALKNPDAQQSRIVRHLLKMTDCRRIFLSGTPVVNRPMEFWQMIDLLGYGSDFGGYQNFKLYYDTKDRRRLEELNQRARQKCYVRRLKKDVLKGLPDKLRTVIPLEIDNRAAYAEAEADIAGYFASKKSLDPAFISKLRADAHEAARELGMDVNELINDGIRNRYVQAYANAEQARALLRWEGLKQMAVRGKMKAVYEWIEEFMGDTDEKLVVFALHTDIIEEITAKYRAKYGAVMIHGQVRVEDRMGIVDRFQNDPKCRLIVGNMQAMGEGLTLTSASNVAFIEYGWNPKSHDQAEDRCHRIGQKDTVNVWNLVAKHTIDEGICALIDEKRAVVEAIQDGAGEATQRGMMIDLQKRLELRRRGVRPDSDELTILDDEETEREVAMGMQHSIAAGLL